MSLRGYKPKTKPANWTTVPGAKVSVKKDGKPKRIRTRSKLRTVEDRLYRIEAREFVADAIRRGQTCPVVAAIPELHNGRKYGHAICARLNEVHHKRGRLGSLQRDRRFWLAVSKQGHRWIHANLEAARERGWVCAIGQWNMPL